MNWSLLGTTELNLQEVSFDPLHSSKNLRGRLFTSTEVISSSSVDVFKRFVPKMIGRMMFDKASVFDLPGKFTSGNLCRYEEIHEYSSQEKET